MRGNYASCILLLKFYLIFHITFFFCTNVFLFIVHFKLLYFCIIFYNCIESYLQYVVTSKKHVFCVDINSNPKNRVGKIILQWLLAGNFLAIRFFIIIHFFTHYFREENLRENHYQTGNDKCVCKLLKIFESTGPDTKILK